MLMGMSLVGRRRSSLTSVGTRLIRKLVSGDTVFRDTSKLESIQARKQLSSVILSNGVLLLLLLLFCFSPLLGKLHFCAKYSLLLLMSYVYEGLAFSMLLYLTTSFYSQFSKYPHDKAVNVAK